MHVALVCSCSSDDPQNFSCEVLSFHSISFPLSYLALRRVAGEDSGGSSHRPHTHIGWPLLLLPAHLHHDYTIQSEIKAILVD